MNPNVGRPYGGNRRVNDGSNRIEGQDRIEGVKLNVPSFKGRSDPDAYLDWEMKIQHGFSCNDYPEEKKVKLAAVTFSDYALVWWNKNQREMKREEEREIDTWTEMRRVMRKSLIVEEYYKEMEMTLVRVNIEEDTKAMHDGFTNKISLQHQDQRISLKPLFPIDVCDDHIRMREKREQEKENSEAPQRNRKKKISTDISNELTVSVSPSVEHLLQEFKDVFPDEIPHELPLSRGIEYQVDLLSGASLPNRPGYKSNPQETQHKDAHAKVEYVKRLYDQVKVQFAKKNESYAKQANKNRKEEVLEPGDDLGHLRANFFQEGWNDENPKTARI
ncbi:hypothetical protein HKD37_03G007626 [Glycine soja]